MAIAKDALIEHAKTIIDHGNYAVLYFGSHQIGVVAVDDAPEEGVLYGTDVNGDGFAVEREAIIAVGERTPIAVQHEPAGGE